MIITTTPSIEDKTITVYHRIVSLIAREGKWCYV